MTEYRVAARRIDGHGSLATAKDAQVVLDTDIAGRRDAMNPVELLLSALAACMLKGIERVTPMLHFQLSGATVDLQAIRQEAPPKLTSGVRRAARCQPRRRADRSVRLRPPRCPG